ncbi:hypothetical protein HNY73_020497 [Argiope bruennichi]|uniref:Uncharacterized protein n=1 Tax=Argiope bruennichi TaxID=94029 RepID=A0A8T0E832_ARGBR|nr:hypothetical protein HNY73_020497 [Argiope bruennichi]
MLDRAVLRSLKEFVIESRTVEWITVFSESKKRDGYVSYSTQDNVSNRITLAVYDGKTQIPVVNPSNLHLQLKKNRAIFRRNFVPENKYELGCINNTTIHITETPGSKSVSSSPYRVSNYERQVLREIVQELKGQSVIRDSCSEYSCPVLLVSKKTGDKRMVID